MGIERKQGICYASIGFLQKTAFPHLRLTPPHGRPSLGGQVGRQSHNDDLERRHRRGAVQHMEKWALFLLLLFAWATSGCSHLILRPDDSPAETTAKVSGRILLGVVTLPALLVGRHSELQISDIK